MKPDARKGHPLLEILVSFVIPALILMKLSGPERLGALGALALALSFPLGWALQEGWRRRRLSFVAALGVASTLLTGGIGLLALDAQWLAIKEAAIPAVIGSAVLISSRTRYPLVRTLLYNPAVLNVERMQKALSERHTAVQFELHLDKATWMVAGTFFFSSAMNYLLARWIVTSPAGTEAFNGELARLTLLSYPLIALPSMLMMLGVLVYLTRAARRLTGLPIAEMLHGGESRATGR